MSTLERQTDGHLLLVVKLFTDDFAQELHASQGSDFDLPKGTTHPKALAACAAYVQAGLRVRGAKGAVQFRALRLEQNHEATWVYMQSTDKVNDPIELHNELMLNRFRDQRNLLIVQHGELQRGYSFDQRVRQIRLSWADL